MALKHVGRIIKTKKKCAIAFRVVPGDPDNCLIVMTESLDAGEHDSLMKLIESNAGQSAYELAEAMSRTTLPDGRNMLAGFYSTGKIQKIRTDLVEVTPNTNSAIVLSELNLNIAQQKGVTVADLAVKDSQGKTKPVAEKTNPVESYSEPTVDTTGVLSDDDLAASYRSQADSLFKEAKRLREEAEKLSPTKRKTKSTESA